MNGIWNFFILGVLTIGAFSCTPNQDKIVFINMETVFNRFELKKELSSKFDNEISMRKTTIDSIEYGIKLLKSNFKGSEEDFYVKFNDKIDGYQYLKKRYEDEAIELTKSYDEQIWKRIDQYIEEYGKENNIDLVLGKTASGNLLYGKNAIDRTEEVITFMNKHYKGE